MVAGGVASDSKSLSDTVSAGSYDVLVKTGSLGDIGDIADSKAPAHRYAIITDSNVAPIYLSRIRDSIGLERSFGYIIAAGELSKTRSVWSDITDAMLSAGCGRDTTVIALGGGVVGDLAGFVAATFMRGVPFVQVPTSLLAMIDASIGGKTGVDTPAGKNLVGAFHSPAAVVTDPLVLATLPFDELRSGFAEALKHGIIADKEYFSALAELGPKLPGVVSGDPGLLASVILKSVRIKADIVATDERERGMRKTLNFGHTVGHAIELLSGFTLKHGYGVAAGMVIEARAGELAGITDRGTADSIAQALIASGLPDARPTGPSGADVLEAMRADKKSRGGRAEYAIPSRIGAMAAAGDGYAVRIPDSVMLEALG